MNAKALFDPTAPILTPNGANSRAIFRLKESPIGNVSTAVFNIRGGKVRGSLPQISSTRFDWDGTDDQGRVVESGLYLVWIKVDGFEAFANTIYVAK